MEWANPATRSASEADRRAARQGQSRELFFDGDAQPLGLLLKETAGAGGADVVHLEVHHHAVVQADVLGILSADFEDGIHVGHDVSGAASLGGDLVADDVGSDDVAGEVPTRARRGHADHADARGPSVAELPQSVAHGLDGPSGGHDVELGHQAARRVQEHQVGRDAADVDAEIDIGDAAVGQGGQCAGQIAGGFDERREATGRHIAMGYESVEQAGIKLDWDPAVVQAAATGGGRR